MNIHNGSASRMLQQPEPEIPAGKRLAAWQGNSLSLLFTAVLLVVTHLAHGQFVDIQVDLPASSRVQSMGSAPSGGTNGSEGQITDQSGGPAALQWLGISVAENLQLAVEITYRKLPEGDTPLPAAYLNNGTSNTAAAVPIEGERVVFAASNGGRLIRQMPRRPKSITAWIGVPPALTRELKIEYN